VLLCSGTWWPRPESARDRFLSAEELQRLGQILRNMKSEGELEPEVAACIRLLALTGCRIGELIALEWRDVDLKAGVPRLPDAKADARIVALGAPAQAILDGLERRDWRVFRFPVGRVQKAWSGEKPRPKKRQKKGKPGIRDRAGIPDVRLHDLRHGYGTEAGGLGLNQFVIRDLLGHKTMAMAGRYVAKHVDPLRQAGDVVSGRIADALDGKPKAEVTGLRWA
jgi:integrase